MELQMSETILRNRIEQINLWFNFEFRLKILKLRENPRWGLCAFVRTSGVQQYRYIFFSHEGDIARLVTFFFGRVCRHIFGVLTNCQKVRILIEDDSFNKNKQHERECDYNRGTSCDVDIHFEIKFSYRVTLLKKGELTTENRSAKRFYKKKEQQIFYGWEIKLAGIKTSIKTKLRPDVHGSVHIRSLFIKTIRVCRFLRDIYLNDSYHSIITIAYGLLLDSTKATTMPIDAHHFFMSEKDLTVKKESTTSFQNPKKIASTLRKRADMFGTSILVFGLDMCTRSSYLLLLSS
ncbi:hypothetical protein Bhyg_05734 [Pseudolycoriella hygida]|uniref:Uncharacterized protein n=1 Tax=Pseudolycoriella hygida TaxID=35572 RepID=A0A9Q0N0N4_9DIPT|nr:hypothetical protein Bhyg_05734 [Pseudolycoriella hygida]